MPEDDGPVTEREQERVRVALHRHLTAGRLDLAQFEARVVRLYAATTRSGARAALDGLPLLPAVPTTSRRRRRGHGEHDDVQDHWVATGELFRDPTSGRVLRVWVDPADGSRHYVASEA